MAGAFLFWGFVSRVRQLQQQARNLLAQNQKAAKGGEHDYRRRDERKRR